MNGDGQDRSPQRRAVQAAGLTWAVTHWTRSGLDASSDASEPHPGPFLLLHGTGASAHSWRGLAPWLARHGEVWALDLPGHGGTQPLPPGRADPSGMGRAVAALCAELRLVPGTVVGHSAGAALALRMVLQGSLPAAALQGGVVAINGALLPLHGPLWPVFSPAARLLAASPWVPRLAAFGARQGPLVDWLLRGTGSHLGPQGAQAYRELVSRPGHVAGALQMMADWDLEALARDLPALAHRLPLTLVVGDRDRTVPPAQARQVAARLPQARCITLTGLGHLAHEEDPVAVYRAILNAARPSGPGAEPPAAPSTGGG